MRRSLMPTAPRQELMTDIFMGYVHKPRIKDGEFFDTRNLSSRYFPMLAPRQRRGKYLKLTAGQGLIEKDALAYVDNGTLYYNRHETPVTGLSKGEKQLVSMGAYICIFPDKVFYNTADANDYGSMEANWDYTGTVIYEMCKSDGTLLPKADESPSRPESPTEGMYWINREDNVLEQWSVSMSTWIEIETVYTKCTFTSTGQIPKLFKEHDGVEISGLFHEDLNGSKILYAAGGAAESGPSAGDAVSDYIVLVGILDNKHTHSSTVKIAREVPDMDYVCEAGNRLWGCFYGNNGKENLNELYCCALGDFKNWHQYLGVSTDSWTGSVGSDGVWTGAVNYLGQPTFFKENHIHAITISSEGGHAVSDLTARGVQKGSAGSLVVVHELLLYKARTGICAYQGAFPEDISDALGEVNYYEAAAGAFGQKYYISMRDGEGVWNFFCYDIPKNLWYREDDLHATEFAKVDDELYCLNDKNEIIALNGTVGELEEDLTWRAETGLMYYQTTGKKYLSRYNIRLNMEPEAEVNLFIEYDSSGDWEFAGRARIGKTGTVHLPVRPKRCDHLRMKIQGSGEVKIYSVSRVLQRSSDVR